jgi:hypothetical protein
MSSGLTYLKTATPPTVSAMVLTMVSWREMLPFYKYSLEKSAKIKSAHVQIFGFSEMAEDEEKSRIAINELYTSYFCDKKGKS